MRSRMPGHGTPITGGQRGLDVRGLLAAEMGVTAARKMRNAPGEEYAELGPLIGWDNLSELMRALDE
jgi:hypothetical protein